MRRPGRRVPAPQTRAVDQVVVHERGEMDELDGNTGDDGSVSTRRSGEVDEERPQPLASGGERLDPDVGHDTTIGADGVLETVLELRQVRVEPGRFADLGERA